MKSIHFLVTLTILSLTLTSIITPTQAQLSPTYYSTTCPNLVNIVRTSIRQAIGRDRRMAASLIRLHFHDCFVQGCDASILLDDAPTIQSEKSAAPNNNSVRGYNVIEDAKTAVERECRGVVSCADILTLAAREASVAVGGPTWNLRFGRMDSTTANFGAANRDLPGPFSTLQGLIDSFDNKQLSVTDMVALSGAHTLGQAQCFLFRTRIYSNGTDIEPNFANTRRRTCPQTGGDTNLAPLDLVTPNSFDNNYYRNLVARRGLLQSDQVLFTGSTAATVSRYSSNPGDFARDFASAMIRMSEISPILLRPNGIRDGEGEGRGGAARGVVGNGEGLGGGEGDEGGAGDAEGAAVVGVGGGEVVAGVDGLLYQEAALLAPPDGVLVIWVGPIRVPPREAVEDELDAVVVRKGGDRKAGFGLPFLVLNKGWGVFGAE
ncbi:lignin-forming anionic peroxidase [Phtheirospermum japonicum]|uniref:peroxidase n=1 Tax=Phtheirospermum japonicum TaxID=374723 RepID=A0A830BE43_9LAMI|nr:lignin-forming anionic peroxidase [Phtheirospermum japonicum]